VNLGAPEILIMGAVIVLLFGAKKLPELARSIGQAKSELEKGHHRLPAEPSDGEAVESAIPEARDATGAVRPDSGTGPADAEPRG
jgi:sec-independent protein translocase protein TatA